jgi:hypothetical protein
MLTRKRIAITSLDHFRMILSYKPQAPSNKLDRLWDLGYNGRITERG